MFDFYDLEQRIERARNHFDCIKIGLRIALGFWRDYRRANKLME